MSASMVFRSLCITSLLLLSGCATNGYSQFYTPLASPADVSANRAGTAPENPIVDHVGEVSPETSGSILKAYAERGFYLIGTSSFVSGSEASDQQAMEQGRKVGADLVVIASPRYAGTTTSAMPFTMPTTSTSYSTGTATAYGPMGSVNAYGSGTTTTYGTSTTMIPITVTRNIYSAAYFVKIKVRFGVGYSSLTDEERRALGSNKGVRVDYVIEDSPAYRADMLVDDIILAVDGSQISGQQSMGEAIDRSAGRSVQVQIIRQGKRMEKTVHVRL